MEKTEKRLKFIAEIFLDIIIIIGLVLIIRTYVISPYQVHGSSMCRTFNYNQGVCENDFGEYLIIAKFKYLFGEPKRGDIIVFRPPNLSKNSKEEFFIKRIIGIPGETLEILNGKVYINGKELKEPYLHGSETRIFNGKDKKFEIPEKKYFVMGDNRDYSIDSRSCFRDNAAGACKGGKTSYITKNMMEGKAWIALFPLNKIGLVSDHEYETN